jgi:hypothetical protein
MQSPQALAELKTRLVKYQNAHNYRNRYTIFYQQKCGSP